MSSNGLYYLDKEELRGFLKLDRVLGAGKDQDQINNDVLEVQEPWITVENKKKKKEANVEKSEMLQKVRQT